MHARLLAITFGLLLATGCAKRLIPGTEIVENDDTTAIISVMNQYRVAVEGRDVDRVLSLVAKDFHDDRGTPTPEDDVDAQTLPAALKDEFSRAQNIRLNIDVRDIDVEDGTATAIYYYTLRYELPGLTERPQSAAELKKMMFQRIDDQWKIVGGI